MVSAAHHAKSHAIPCLGICLGMQTMVIAHARHSLGLTHADSTEFDRDTVDPVVHLLDDQVNVKHKGGTMRLGSYTSQVKQGTRLAQAYGDATIQERHRHRYEVNNAYVGAFEHSGLKVNCMTDDYLVEGVEWEGHPFGVGVQYHPELRSKPLDPHPLFKAFIGSAVA